MGKKNRYYTVIMIGDNNINAEDAAVIGYYAMNFWEDFEPNYKFIVDNVPEDFEEKDFNDPSNLFVDKIEDKIIAYNNKLKEDKPNDVTIAFVLDEKKEAVCAYIMKKDSNAITKYNKNDIKETIEERLSMINKDDVLERYTIARIGNSKRRLSKHKKGLFKDAIVSAIGVLMVELSKKSIQYDLSITHSTRTLSTWLNAFFYTLSVIILAFGVTNGALNIYDLISETIHLKKMEKSLTLKKN